MATQGSKATYSGDVQEWYTIFNNIINTDNFGISALTVPDSGSKILATHINDLVDKVSEFRNNEYLSTQISWFPVGTKVTAGVTKITPSSTTFIDTVISNATKIKCANTATKTCGTHSSTCGSGSKGSGIKSDGTHSSGICPEGKHWNSAPCSSHCGSYGCCVKSCSSGSNTISYCSYSTNSVDCSCGTVNCHNGPCGSGPNSITCPNGSHTVECSSGTCSCGTKENTTGIIITCKQTTCSLA